jgi:tetratricopeptide (TPR) repeat protein
LVVPAEGEPWRRVVELRIEDHPQPLEELARVLTLHEAYELATEAENLGAEGRHEEAGVAGRRALELAPDNPELTFWAGLALANQGQLDLGVALVRRAIEIHPGWRDLLGRLSTEIAPGAEAVREALGVTATG